MWYKVDFKILMGWMLPTFMRKAITIAILKSFINPIEKLFFDWGLIRDRNLYKLAHNGQTCYFRKALNDAFDNELRRIYIGNGNSVDRLYIYTRQENRPLHLGKVYLNSRDDFTGNAIDFIVYVPTSVKEQFPYRLDALIKYYKQASKRYKIIAI